MIGDSNNEANFPHKLLFTDTQFWSIYKALVNNLSANIKLSKTQLCKVVLLGGFISYLNMLDKLSGFKLMKPFIEEIGQTKVLPKSKNNVLRFPLNIWFQGYGFRNNAKK